MIAGLLLAAGGARRFGSQKLVATLDDVPLVRHAAQALAQETDELIVVVGSESAAVTRALDGIDARIVENAEWERGLSTSIRCGVARRRSRYDRDCRRAGRRAARRRRCVACGHFGVARVGPADRRRALRGEIGHPVLFDATVFRRIDGAGRRSRRDAA